MNYDEYEDVYEEARHEILSETRGVSENHEVISINFKKELLVEIFKDTLNEHCKYVANDVKQEAITQIKKSLIEEKFDEILKQELRQSIKVRTDQLIDDFMDREITISAGYYDTKTIKCRDLIEEDIEKFLKRDLNGNIKDFISGTVDSRTKKKIDDYETSLRNETRSKIDNMFNQTTKNALSEQLFYILSQNETYQKISSSINCLIEDK